VEVTAIAVTPGEQAQYRHFAIDQLMKTGRPGVGELFHYTSGDGLIGIIGSGQLWATQVSCVNDASEIRYATSLLREMFRGHRSIPPLDPDELFICDRVIEALSVDAAPTSEWFIACLTEEKDDLSQWRAYGRGEGGYAIGFDAARLSYSVPAIGGYLAGVCYKPAVHTEIARAVTLETLRFFKQGLLARPGVDRGAWAEVFLPEWRNYVSLLAPIIKQSGFAAENEWRIIHGLDANDFSDLKFRQRGSMLVRHLPLKLRFPPETMAAPLLPISSVRVGPSRHQAVSKISVGDLLRGKGYDKEIYENVRVSDVPFQAF
jgi:DUF2971 family protein